MATIRSRIGLVLYTYYFILYTSSPIFALLKKYIAISLITAYLFCTTELHQLLKLPVLIEHFSEHKELNPNISFFDFLSMHYAATEDHDGDSNSTDEELPFKSHDNCISNNISIGNPPSIENFSFDPLSVFQKNIPIHSEAFIASSFLSNIWQPPQLS